MVLQEKLFTQKTCFAFKPSIHSSFVNALKKKTNSPLGSFDPVGLGYEGFFIHSKGDLAGCGLEDVRGSGEGQSSSRLEPRERFGGAPDVTEMFGGSPMSEVELAGSVL